MNTETQIKNALRIAVRFGGIGGDHHKAWVIDQMCRSLLGGEPIFDNSNDVTGFTESGEYHAFTEAACDGDDGPETYTWEKGIAP